MIFMLNKMNVNNKMHWLKVLICLVSGNIKIYEQKKIFPGHTTLNMSPTPLF